MNSDVEIVADNKKNMLLITKPWLEKNICDKCIPCDYKYLRRLYMSNAYTKLYNACIETFIVKNLFILKKPLICL